VLFVMCLAFGPRWLAVVGQLSAPLSRDPTMVGVVAASMSHPFDTWVREPLWIWLLRAHELFFGQTALAGRMFSFTLSMVWLAVAFEFARRYFASFSYAVLTLVLLALHPSMIISSAEAHRTELYGAGLALVAIFAFSPRFARRVRSVGFAVAAALVALTQVAGLIPVVGASIWALKARRISAPALLAIGVVVGAVLLPSAVYSHQRFGQAFYFARTLVPTYYRNVEFLLVTSSGCDGCPTPAEVAVNRYSGRPATMKEYLFTLHTPGEVARRIGRGYAEVFVWPGKFLAGLLGMTPTLLFHLPYVVGLIVAVTTRARDLLVIPVLSLNLLAFVVPIGIDPRLLLHIAPFTAMLIVVGVRSLLLASRKLGFPFSQV
jgi:hypothetical protein